jgi:hypothetical protein
MKQVKLIGVYLLALAIMSFANSTNGSEPDSDLADIINAIEAGWEHGDGASFNEHFLDFEGARYIESGGQNEGLADLVENHVKPEGDFLAGLDLTFAHVETHIEGDFA